MHRIEAEIISHSVGLIFLFRNFSNFLKYSTTITCGFVRVLLFISSLGCALQQKGIVPQRPEYLACKVYFKKSTPSIAYLNCFLFTIMVLNAQ